VYAAAGILCITGAVMAWRAFLSANRRLHRGAALPDLTGDPADQYFSEGLTTKSDSLARNPPSSL